MVSKVTIQEANKHLHAMHLHSTYLENSLQECKEIMKQNNERHGAEIKALKLESAEEINKANEKVKELEREKQQLQNTLKEKEKEISLLNGRLSVFKQIFQYLPGLRSFLSVIENARQLVKDSDTDATNGPVDANVQRFAHSVSSIANHYIPNKNKKTLSVSSESDEEEDDGLNISHGNKEHIDMSVKSAMEKDAIIEKTAEVYL